MPLEEVGLQEVRYREAFDGTSCLDAMEFVFRGNEERGIPGCRAVAEELFVAGDAHPSGLVQQVLMGSSATRPADTPGCRLCWLWYGRLERKVEQPETQFGDGLEPGADQRACSPGSGVGFRTGPNACHPARVEMTASSAIWVRESNEIRSRIGILGECGIVFSAWLQPWESGDMACIRGPLAARVANHGEVEKGEGRRQYQKRSLHVIEPAASCWSLNQSGIGEQSRSRLRYLG